MSGLPITERSNALSIDIDTASPQDILKITGQCEKEIYAGWETYEGLSSSKFQKMMEDIAGQICSSLKQPQGKAIVLSGCGTSGRLAFMAARSANEILKGLGIEPIFDYLIAGNDKALMLSIESAEDRPHHGIQLLKDATLGKEEVLFIGITCGFSAPFVAGQLDYCLDQPNFTPVLIGFNHCDLARNIPIENWHKTFRKVVERMQEAETSGRAFILNPVIGPEPITGSSRMKGGSATKIILDTIIDMAYDLYSGKSVNATVKLREYENAHRTVYNNASEDIGHIIQMAGQSLCAGGHIYYVGMDSLGFVGVVDASECVPTFGADENDVRGFLQDGFTALRNKDGDLTHEVQISAEYFLREMYPTLSSNNTVIFISLDGELPSVPEIMIPAQRALLLLVENPDIGPADYYNSVAKLVLPSASEPFANENIRHVHLAEIMCKWVCNAISTGAHIIRGKVYENSMIDVKVRNNKLYFRAVNMIQKYVKVTPEEAEYLLLRSIYMTDSLTDAQRNAPVSSHICVAASLNKVVPRAMVLGSTSCNIETAENTLTKSPRIRTMLTESLKK